MNKNRSSSAYCPYKWKKRFLILKVTLFLLHTGVIHLSASLEEFSGQVTVPSGFFYKTNTRVADIQKVSERNVFPFSEEKSQPRNELSGVVLDVNGNTIVGVNVYIKGTTVGSITDVNGNFSLLVPSDAEILVFSFIGMVTQEIPIGTTTVFRIVMQEAALEMDEVIVVGYGEQKKQSVVGAISTATGDQLKRMNVSEVSNSLTGSIPGLITIQQTSVPGGGDINTLMAGSSGDVDQRTKIFIRGQSTWSGGEPLILVDGIERRMEELDPNEINSVSVLKDASATSVFGVRGANGVILITTRRGSVGKPVLSFEGQHTTSMISKIARPLNSYNVLELRNRAIVNELNMIPESWNFYLPQEVLNYYKNQDYPDIFVDTDWPSALLKNASSSYKFNTNVRGGTEFVRYFGSLGYIHEGGIFKGEDLGQGYTPDYSYDRFNFRSNLDFQFSKTTKMSLNLAGNYGITTNPGFGDSPRGRMIGLYSMPPDLYPVRYSDGYYGGHPSIVYSNPYIALNLSGLDRVNQGQIFADVSLEQKLDVITKGLSVAATASYDYTLTERGRRIGGTEMAVKWIDPRIIYAAPEDSAAFIHLTFPTSTHGYDFYPEPTSYYAGLYHSLSRRLFYQGSLNYSRDFGKHSFGGLALMNRRESGSGSSFINKREDWVGRITYDYDSRYFIEFNAGYNGSEKFDRKYRFGFFPSVGGGWMISNESFFKEAFPWWSTFKIRYSHGIVGSDDGIERWLYTGSWRKTNAQWIFGKDYTDSGYGASFEGAVPNPDIHWETAVKRDIGIETGFLDNSLKLTFDYFTDNRSDMLIAADERTTPVTIGAPLPPGNLGKTETHGYELDLEYRKYFNIGIGLASRFSVGYVQDKVIYRDDPDLMPAYRKQEGYPIDQTRSWTEYGIIQNWDEMYYTALWANKSNMIPGEFRFIDFNADGVINNDDKIPYGYPSRPEYNYSYNFSLSYKGFTVYGLLYGVFNVNVDQQYHWDIFYNNQNVAFPWDLTDRWSPEQGITLDAKNIGPKFQALPGTRGNESSVYNIIDGSYLRLKNAEISYQVPKKLFKGSGLNSLRLYFTGYNLFTWTKDDWREDREAAGGGFTLISYPLMKRYTFGLALGL